MSSNSNTYLAILCLISTLLTGNACAENTQRQAAQIPDGLSETEWLSISRQTANSNAASSAGIHQQAYIKASNTDAFDDFARVVAISGDTLVVGAAIEGSNTTGVNGDQDDNSLNSAGAVYVFIRTGSSWSQQAYLKASNTAALDRFGTAVAVSSDTIVVGAIGEDSNATGINGDEDDNSASSSGAVYVFTRTAGVWSQQAYVKAANTGRSDLFGSAVAISGDTLVVGAPQEGNLSTHTGAAYVFVRTGTDWIQQYYLKISNPDNFDHFGSYVTISGDTLAVGVPEEDSNATGIDGDETDDSAEKSGAVYVFVRAGSGWNQQAYVKASNTQTNDRFGASLSLSDNTLVVGAYGEGSNATGINGDQDDNTAPAAGAAYIFTRTANIWSQQAYLKASNTQGSDRFGYSVSITGNTLAIGAWDEDSNATGVNGDEHNNLAPGSGAAYVFKRMANAWSQQAYVKSSTMGLVGNHYISQFGLAVAVSNNTLAAGTPSQHSNATGIDGDENNDLAIGSGAAYVFSLVDNNQDSDADGIPDVLDDTPNLQDPNDCTGTDAILSGDIAAGTQVSCRASNSIATDVNGITVAPDAVVAIVAPQVTLNRGFSAMVGSTVIVINQP